MTKKRLVKLLIFTLIFSAVLVANAALHFLDPGPIANGSRLSMFAEIAGYGSDTTQVFVSAHVISINVQAVCQNKGNRVPAGKTFNFDISQTQVVQVQKNGRATAHFDVELAPDPSDAGCNSDSWKVVDFFGTLRIDYLATDLSSGATDTFSEVCTKTVGVSKLTCS